MPTPPPPSGAESLLADLQRMQAYAAELGSIVAKAQDAAPARSAATDASGVATAEVDASGAPVSLTLERGWDARVDAEALGGILLEAYQSALQQHLAQWGDDLKRDNWHFDAREIDDRVAEAATGPSPFRAPVSFGQPRAVSQLVEDVLGELDRSHQLAQQPVVAPATTEPADDGRRVRVTLVSGQLSSLHVDPAWARGKDAGQINAELASSLQSARLAQPRPQPPADHLDDLFGEVMQSLQRLRTER